VEEGEIATKLTRRRLLPAVIVGCFAVMIATHAFTQQNDHEQGFPPLARVRVSATDVDLLVKTLHEFGISEDLRLVQGSFTRDDRLVTQVTLRKARDSTFFHVSDFRRPMQFEITAYSHEDEQAWRPLWTRLNQRLVSVFGASNVKNDADELKTDPHLTK
jgi:hypothetical protein